MLQQDLRDPKLYEAETTLSQVEPILHSLDKQLQDLKTEVEKCKRLAHLITKRAPLCPKRFVNLWFILLPKLCPPTHATA